MINYLTFVFVYISHASGTWDCLKKESKDKLHGICSGKNSDFDEVGRKIVMITNHSLPNLQLCSFF